MEVTGAGEGSGTLSLGAGRDATLTGTRIENRSEAGHTRLQAGGDLTLATVTESASERSFFDAGNHYGSASSREVGSEVRGNGNVVLDADGDMSLRAARMQSTRGNVFVTADGDIALEAGRQTAESDFTATSTSKRLFSRSTTKEERGSDCTTR